MLIEFLVDYWICGHVFCSSANDS